MSQVIDTKHALLLDRTGDTPAARLVMGLLTTTRQIDAACAALLAEHGMTEGRLSALLAISADPGVTPARLAEVLGVTRATVTGLTNGLVTAGYVMRRTDGPDRRSITLHITTDGDALLAAITPLYATWLAELTTGLDTSAQTALLTTLATIQRKLMSPER